MLSMLRELVFGVGFALVLPIWFGLDGVPVSYTHLDAGRAHTALTDGTRKARRVLALWPTLLRGAVRRRTRARADERVRSNHYDACRAAL